MIHFHAIHNVEDPLWPQFLTTYTSSFPIDEQRPVHNLAQLLSEEPRFSAMVLLDKENRFTGIFTTWRFATFIYIEHFALPSALRSKGTGSLALHTFIEANPLPIVLEAEPPTTPIARRRISFYERCGLTLYDFAYTQPPYAPDRSAVPLRLMGTLSPSTPLADVADTLHREVYKTK